MTSRHRSDSSAAPQQTAHAVSQPAAVHHSTPMASPSMMPPLPPAGGYAMPMAQHRTPSGTRGGDISSHFKQQEAKRLNRIAGRPTSGSKSTQSQLAMMQASLMQQNNMMMMQMMSQQQQRYAGNQMAWNQLQHIPPHSAEGVPATAPPSTGAPAQLPQAHGMPMQHYAAASSAPSSMNSMSRQSSHDPGTHTQRQTTLPNAAALGTVVAADQAAPQQHGNNDRAAQASEEAAIDRKAALKVLQEVEAKFQELRKHQGKLVAKISTMQQRIAEKDAMIDTLRARRESDAKLDEGGPRADGPLEAELEERDALTNELSRLRLQMMDTQTTMEDAVSTGRVLAEQFEDAGAGGAAEASGADGAAAHGTAPAGASAAAADSISVAGSHLDTYGTASSTSGAAGSNQEAAAGRAGPAVAAAAAAGPVGGEGQVGAGKEQLGTAQEPDQRRDAGGDHGMDADRGGEVQRSTVPHSEQAEAPRSGKKVMMWQQVAAPAEPPAALQRKASLKGAASVMRDDEGSDPSTAPSTATDSGGTHRSQQSPAAAGRRRHVFQPPPDNVQDSSESASLRLPILPDVAKEQRSRLDKIFGRSSRR